MIVVVLVVTLTYGHALVLWLAFVHSHSHDHTLCHIENAMPCLCMESPKLTSILLMTDVLSLTRPAEENVRES